MVYRISTANQRKHRKAEVICYWLLARWLTPPPPPPDVQLLVSSSANRRCASLNDGYLESPDGFARRRHLVLIYFIDFYLSDSAVSACAPSLARQEIRKEQRLTAQFHKTPPCRPFIFPRPPLPFFTPFFISLFIISLSCEEQTER